MIVFIIILRTARQYQDITVTFHVTSQAAKSISFLEHVVVSMSLDLYNYGIGYDYEDFIYEATYYPDEIYEWLQDPHPKRGDIQITLTSPHGTTSTLLPYRLYDFVNENGYTDWPFMTVHHWGENPVGTWTLRVKFRSSSGYVSASIDGMRLYGTTTTPQAVANIPARCDPACRGACSGPGPNNCDICRELRVAETQECVSSCPNGTKLYKSYCLGGKNNPDNPDSGSNNFIYILSGGVGGGCLLLLVVIVAVAITIVWCKRKSSRSYEFQRLPVSDNRPTNV